MADWVITEEPVFNRSGKKVAVDRIRRPTAPLPPADIPAGKVQVICGCGTRHMVPEAEWAKWGNMAPADRAAIKQGACDCKHFKPLST